MGRIVSFRGIMDEGTQQRINLHTNDGKKGYQIKKFQIFPHFIGHTDNYESLVQLFTVEQTTVPTSNANCDFGDITLLAAAFYQNNAQEQYASSLDVVFDNMKFNQDIFVTYTDSASATIKINYYIELEQMDLTEDEALVAIVKNLRNEQ